METSLSRTCESKEAQGETDYICTCHSHSNSSWPPSLAASRCQLLDLREEPCLSTQCRLLTGVRAPDLLLLQEACPALELCGRVRPLRSIGAREVPGVLPAHNNTRF